MELDLGNNAYDILNDWHPNAAKEELTANNSQNKCQLRRAVTKTFITRRSKRTLGDELTAKRASGCDQT